MAKTVPSFGSIHTANSVGFKWAPEYRLFIRITPAGNFYKVELQPPTFDPGKENVYLNRPIAAIWHGQEGILNFLPVLNKYMGRTTPHTFAIDDDGMELPRENPTPPVQIETAIPEPQQKEARPEELPAKPKRILQTSATIKAPTPVAEIQPAAGEKVAQQGNNDAVLRSESD